MIEDSSLWVYWEFKYGILCLKLKFSIAFSALLGRFIESHGIVKVVKCMKVCAIMVCMWVSIKLLVWIYTSVQYIYAKGLNISITLVHSNYLWEIRFLSTINVIQWLLSWLTIWDCMLSCLWGFLLCVKSHIVGILIRVYKDLGSKVLHPMHY